MNSQNNRTITVDSRCKPSKATIRAFLASSLATLGFFLSIGDYTHVDYLISAIKYVITNHPDCLPKENPFGFYSIKELFQNPNLMAEAIKNRSSLPVIKEVVDNLSPIVEESKSHNDVIPRNNFSVMSEAVRDPNLIGDLNRIYANIALRNNFSFMSEAVRDPNLIGDLNRVYDNVAPRNNFSVMSEALRDPNLIGDLNRVYDNVAPRNNLPIERELIQAPDLNTKFKIKRLTFDIKATSPNIQALDSSIKASRSAIQFPALNIQDPEPTPDDKYRTTVRIVSFIIGSICTAAV